MRFASKALSQVALLVLTHFPSSVGAGIRPLDKLESGGVRGDTNSSGKAIPSAFHHAYDVAESGMPKNFDRDLQQYACNEIINIFPVEVVKQIIGGILTQYSGIPEVVSIVNEAVPLLEHDVQMMKVCGSCESESLSGYGCEEDDYGYGTTHSGLLLIPVDFDQESSSISIIDTEVLQTWMQFRFLTPTHVDSSNSVYQYGAGNVEFQMMAASMGLASISPEKMGFGESYGLVPSGGIKKATVTSLLPLLQKARSIVSFQSNGMTSIGNEAYYMGYSEGGFSAISAADGLLQHGVTPVKILSGGAPIKIRSVGTFKSLNDHAKGLLDPERILILALASLPLSGTRPGIATYGSGQPLIAPALLDDILKLFTDLGAPSFVTSSSEFFEYIFNTYPLLASAVLTNQKIIDPIALNFATTAFAAGEVDPCKNNPQSAIDAGVDKICEALDENDLTDALLQLSASYDVDLCHSVDDTFVGIENVPDMSLLTYEVTGTDHTGSFIPCMSKLFYGTSIEKPALRTEPPEDPEETEAPTESPKQTDAPTEAPKQTDAPTEAPKQTDAPTGGAVPSSKAPKKMKKTAKKAKKSKTPKVKAPKKMWAP